MSLESVHDLDRQTRGHGQSESILIGPSPGPGDLIPACGIGRDLRQDSQSIRCQEIFDRKNPPPKEEVAPRARHLSPRLFIEMEGADDPIDVHEKGKKSE